MKLRKPALGVVKLYLFAAVATKVAEAAGMHKCGCCGDCWCRKPGLSLFRWVAPVAHKTGLSPDDKAAWLAENRP